MAETPSKLSRYLRSSSIGLQLGGCVIVGLLVGQWLDGKFGTAPWLLLLFLGFGMAAGFLSVYRLLKELGKPQGPGDGSGS